MYDDQVLGKFPVVQHFRFGSLFVWDLDPASRAAAVAPSVHIASQPVSSNQFDTTAPPLTSVGAGTAAPWAKPTGAAMGPPPPPTGIPYSRVPWASSAAGTGVAAGAASARAMMPPPTVPSARKTAGGGAGVDGGTKAPWAMPKNEDGGA